MKSTIHTHQWCETEFVSLNGLSRNYLIIEVATAVECQISLIIIKVDKPFSDADHNI